MIMRASLYTRNFWLLAFTSDEARLEMEKESENAFMCAFPIKEY